MLRKRLGIEATEINWSNRHGNTITYYKIPSTLIIPEGCVKIGDYAFCSCDDSLREVIIPESVEEIGNLAFGYCNNTTIILKRPRGSFKYIENSAFYYTKDVKEETRG